jgi:acyl carrier protein
MTDRLKRLMAITFGVPAREIPDDVAAGDFPRWNSLAHLELMMAVEMEFQIQVPSDQMLELSSLGAIEDFLRAQDVAV